MTPSPSRRTPPLPGPGRRLLAASLCGIAMLYSSSREIDSWKFKRLFAPAPGRRFESATAAAATPQSARSSPAPATATTARSPRKPSRRHARERQYFPDFADISPNSPTRESCCPAVFPPAAAPSPKASHPHRGAPNKSPAASRPCPSVTEIFCDARKKIHARRDNYVMNISRPRRGSLLCATHGPRRAAPEFATEVFNERQVGRAATMDGT